MGGAVEFEQDPAIAMRWRVGRSVGRTIYAMAGLTPSKGDTLIGMMDSRELAGRVVEAHNALLRAEAVADLLPMAEPRPMGEVTG